MAWRLTPERDRRVSAPTPGLNRIAVSRSPKDPTSSAHEFWLLPGRRCGSGEGRIAACSNAGGSCPRLEDCLRGEGQTSASFELNFDCERPVRWARTWRASICAALAEGPWPSRSSCTANGDLFAFGSSDARYRLGRATLARGWTPRPLSYGAGARRRVRLGQGLATRGR